MNVVREHIKSIPAYEFYYTRTENPNRKYLPSNITIIGIYKLYLEYCTDKIKPVGDLMYRRIFYSEFNFYFYSPLKDPCSKDDAYKNKLPYIENEQQKKHMITMHKLHLRKAEAARTAIKEDTTISKNDPNVYAFTFDL